MCVLDLGLLAVADGMGGHNAGDVASSLALQALYGFLQKSAERTDFTWPCAYDPRLSPNTNRLNAAFRVANTAVNERAARDPQCAGMGTTVVAALVDGPTMTFASVGDSRLYQLRDNVLQCLTEDDSWVTALSRQNKGEAADFKDHPMRHVLTNVVGGRSDLRVTVSEVMLQDQDVLLLCSDGLYRGIPEDVIGTVLRQEQDLQRAAELLVTTAVERDGADNTSAVVARYAAPPKTVAG